MLLEPCSGSTHFGFSRVKSSEKATLVRSVHGQRCARYEPANAVNGVLWAHRGVFDRVADQYDVMNDLMSAGMHRV
jgi:hypothetical protein